MEASAFGTEDQPRKASGGAKAGAILGGFVATVASALWLYVFIEVVRDDDPTRTTTGFEKVISAFPGIPAAALGLLALPAAIYWAVKDGRGRGLLRASLIALAVATVIYVLLVVIKG